MKIKALILVALFLIFPVYIIAQEDGILETFKKSAVKYGNDKDGDGVEDEPETRSEENSDTDKERLEREKKWQKKWNDMLKNLDPSEGFMQFFEGKFENCIYVMVNYLSAMDKLANLTEEEGNCKMKYDLYGTQVVALAMSTTISYCPEYIEKMSKTEYGDNIRRIGDKFSALNESDKNYSSIKKFLLRLDDIIVKEDESYTYENEPYDEQVLLTNKFHPNYIILRSLDIQQKMEALGCGD